MKFNPKYDININEIIYYAMHLIKNKYLANSIYREWTYTLKDFAKYKIYENNNLNEYHPYDKDKINLYKAHIDEYHADFKNFGASRVLWHKDDNGYYVAFTDEFDVYLTNLKTDEYPTTELDVYDFKHKFPSLFLVKLYVLNLTDVMEVFDFLDHQIYTNFNNSIMEFKNFYTRLKHFCNQNDFLYLFIEVDGIIKDYYEIKSNQLYALDEVDLNVIDNTKTKNTKELSLPKKMIFLKEIKYLDFLKDKLPNLTLLEYAEIIQKNVFEDDLEKVRRILSSVEYGDTKSPYKKKYASELIEKIKSIPNKDKIITSLFVNSIEDDFWGKLNCNVLKKVD